MSPPANPHVFRLSGQRYFPACLACTIDKSQDVQLCCYCPTVKLIQPLSTLRWTHESSGNHFIRELMPIQRTDTSWGSLCKPRSCNPQGNLQRRASYSTEQSVECHPRSGQQMRSTPHRTVIMEVYRIGRILEIAQLQCGQRRHRDAV